MKQTLIRGLLNLLPMALSLWLFWSLFESLSTAWASYSSLWWAWTLYLPEPVLYWSQLGICCRFTVFRQPHRLALELD